MVSGSLFRADGGKGLKGALLWEGLLTRHLECRVESLQCWTSGPPPDLNVQTNIALVTMTPDLDSLPTLFVSKRTT